MKIVLCSMLMVVTVCSSYGQSVPDMLEKTLGAVVTVGVHEEEIVKRQLGFRGESAPDIAYEKALSLADVSSSGSGFIIEKNGKLYVITNAHVVEEASDEPGSVYVYSINRSKYEVRVVGGDSFYDLAVLEFVDTPGNEINTISFRDTDVRIGEKVFAIGNPLGEYPYTVTDGIISAKNRVRESMTGKFGFFQTTATIIWGNSGGPLLDAHGRVVGVVASKLAAARVFEWTGDLPQNINYAVKSAYLRTLLESKGIKHTSETTWPNGIARPALIKEVNQSVVLILAE